MDDDRGKDPVWVGVVVMVVVVVVVADMVVKGVANQARLRSKSCDAHARSDTLNVILMFVERTLSANKLV